jgi:UDP-N-acetylglucosamine 2-epimerase
MYEKSEMKIMTVAGARPNFMKVAPLIAAIQKHNKEASRINATLSTEAIVPEIDHILVHTGQHHDAAMSDSFFADLNLPAPDIHLGVSAASIDCIFTIDLEIYGNGTREITMSKYRPKSMEDGTKCRVK